MFDKKTRLGKGLEALIPKTYMTSGRTIINIALSEIRPNPLQPRTEFSEESLTTLANSIKRYGVAQPVLVRRKNDFYELIAGERRYRACLEANIEFIPAIVKDISDVDSLKLALVENLEREDLNPIEESRGYDRLIQEFGMTHQLIAEIFGKSRSGITNTLRLLKLPLKAQEALINGKISEGHARSLLSLEDEVDILMQLEKIIQQNLNVREVEQVVQMSVKKPTKQKPQSQSIQLNLFQEMEESLTQKYHVPIKIKGSKARGEIVIKYKSVKELESIYQKLTG